jgi:tRNA(Leu) C34 or U34 (ribose-2'-O)-methylase TrmL
MVAIQGDRTPVRACTDTMKAWRHIPVVRGDDLHAMIPFDTVPVAIDLVDGAVELPAYQHPLRAFYVFGPEDGTLGRSVLEWCEHRVVVPTRHCMNLAATVNVVLYDRMAKAHRMSRGISYRELAL